VHGSNRNVLLSQNPRIQQCWSGVGQQQHTVNTGQFVSVSKTRQRRAHLDIEGQTMGVCCWKYQQEIRRVYFGSHSGVEHEGKDSLCMGPTLLSS